MLFRTITLMMFLLVGAGCIFTGEGFLETDIQTLADVEGFIGAALPESAVDVRHETGGFQDPYAFLRFSAPPEDVTAFLTALNIALDTVPANPDIDDAGRNLAWWTPGEATVVATGSGEANFVNYRVTIDQADADAWTVYLATFSKP